MCFLETMAEKSLSSWLISKPQVWDHWSNKWMRKKASLSLFRFSHLILFSLYQKIPLFSHQKGLFVLFSLFICSTSRTAENNAVFTSTSMPRCLQSRLTLPQSVCQTQAEQGLKWHQLLWWSEFSSWEVQMNSPPFATGHENVSRFQSPGVVHEQNFWEICRAVDPASSAGWREKKKRI